MDPTSSQRSLEVKTEAEGRQPETWQHEKGLAWLTLLAMEEWSHGQKQRSWETQGADSQTSTRPAALLTLQLHSRRPWNKQQSCIKFVRAAIKTNTHIVNMPGVLEVLACVSWYICTLQRSTTQCYHPWEHLAKLKNHNTKIRMPIILCSQRQRKHQQWKMGVPM